MKYDDDHDGRHAVTRGYVLATRVSSIGIQMALPPAAGWWADQRFHTEPWLMCLGAVLGLAISMVEILRLAKEANDSGR